MFRTRSLLLSLTLSVPLYAICPTPATVAIGGRASVAAVRADSLTSTTVTYIDFTRPAVITTSVNHVDFAFYSADGQSFTASFGAVTPVDKTYNMTQKSTAKTFTPPAGTFPGIAIYSTTIPNLTFRAGDLLAVTIISAASNDKLAAVYTDRYGGFAAYSSDIAQGATTVRDLGMKVRDLAIAAEATDTRLGSGPGLTCVTAPVTEVMIPVAGDIIGATHYATSLTISTELPYGQTQTSAILHLRNRAGASSDGLANVPVLTRGAVHIDDLPGTLSLTPPFIGTLTVTLTGFAGVYDARYLSVTGRIAAASPNGELVTPLPAVSCDQIGRNVKIAFHVPPGHRLNIGVSSADLASCGVARQANAVDITVGGGSPTTFDLTSGSGQWNDVTGPNGAIGAQGMVDGVITIRVTDEASRIVAFGSLLDNQSQDSSITIAQVIE